MLRRDWLKTTAALIGPPMLLPRGSALGYTANEQLQLAIVGAAGYGAVAGFVSQMHIHRSVRITWLCDVDQRKSNKPFEVWAELAAKFEKSDKPEERAHAARYRELAESRIPLEADYRRLLDEHSGEIDAVVVATPDHTHAAASAWALRAGKPVYCEKPLTVRVGESRALRTLALRAQVATQLGNQGTASGAFRRGVEFVEDGQLGRVSDVHIWFARGGRNASAPPAGTPPVPPELNWDLWLGPVAYRPYHPEWIARTHWRDTSAGQLGNFGPHTANLPFRALHLAELWNSAPAGTDVSRAAKAPTIRVRAECSSLNRLSFPVWERIVWEVPARGALPPVKFYWHHGPDYCPGARPMLEQLLRDYGADANDLKQILTYAGVALVGEKGLLAANSHNTQVWLLPKGRFEDLAKRNLQRLSFSPGHHQEWLAACRGGPEPVSNFLHTTKFNEFLMLGDIATRFPDRVLEYDPWRGMFVNDAEADAELIYPYRQGWRLLEA